jgi:nucleoid-associated protein YgaU
MADEMEKDGKNSLEEARARIAANQAKKEAIAEHVVEEGETLSHIALEHYGNAGAMYYTAIYEANKDVIGDNMNVIKPGQVLAIPPKPEAEDED